METPIGYMPTDEAIDIEGLDVSAEEMHELLKVDKEEWLKEVESIKEHYNNYEPKLPQELKNQLKALEERLRK